MREVDNKKLDKWIEDLNNLDKGDIVAIEKLYKNNTEEFKNFSLLYSGFRIQDTNTMYFSSSLYGIAVGEDWDDPDDFVKHLYKQFSDDDFGKFRMMILAQRTANESIPKQCM